VSSTIRQLEVRVIIFVKIGNYIFYCKLYLCDNHILHKLFAFKIDHKEANLQTNDFALATWCDNNSEIANGSNKLLFEYYTL